MQPEKSKKKNNNKDISEDTFKELQNKQAYLYNGNLKRETESLHSSLE